MIASLKNFQLSHTFDRYDYFVRGFGSYYLPRFFFEGKADKYLRKLTPAEKAEVELRADYYCKLPAESTQVKDGIRIGDYRFDFNSSQRFSTYFFDLYRPLKYFPDSERFAYLFGDVIHEPDSPTIVKSRPITNGPTNSVVLKLDSVRHFRFVKDNIPFADKQFKIVSRTYGVQPHRRLLMEMYFGHPLCDMGVTGRKAIAAAPQWEIPFMKIPDQLTHQFIACLEGNDVATNLKWVMSSNSIAVMPKPKYETWYMEGTLIPDVHYMEIAPDYSDLIDKMTYYHEHPLAAQKIIDNAHAYVRKFQNRKIEFSIQLRVLQKYFSSTH